MLDIETAKQLGIKACIDKLGYDFVSIHKDCATSAYGKIDDSVFCFVGVDHNYENSKDKLILDSVSEFPYKSSCNVSLIDGTITFNECVLPE